MPYLDGTGPRGMGPMTGRRMGRCAGNFRFGIPTNKNDEKKILEQEKKDLEENIKYMQSRLAFIDEKLRE